jgi:hypothetical protein
MTYEEVDKLVGGQELRPRQWYHLIATDDGPTLSTEVPKQPSSRLCSFLTDENGQIKRWEKVGDWFMWKTTNA